jgi:alpha-ribazole phosphatase
MSGGGISGAEGGPGAVTRWWWIRHAPVVNPDGIFYGQRDLPAELDDAAPGTALAAALPAGAVWVVTPLRRTAQTADAIRACMREPGPDPVVEAGLIEQSFGDWQGRPQAEVFAAPDGELHPFWRRPARERPPGGESYAELTARVREAVRRLCASHRGHDLIAVAHGGTVRAAVALALDLTPEAALRVVADCWSLTRLDYVELPGQPPAWRVGWVNRLPR